MSPGQAAAGLLSPRERAIAERYAQGRTHREIGVELCIAPTTVRTHLANIFGKLDVHSRTALAGRIGTSRQREPPSGNGTPVVAVMPFDSIGGDEYSIRLAEGLHADLTTDLARHPDLVVISRHTMVAYRGRVLDLRALGREVGAGFIIEGTLQRDAGRVRATTRLVDTDTGGTVWSARYDRPDGEIFAVQDEVVRTIVNTIAGCSGCISLVQREVARRKPPASLAAYDLYRLGVADKHKFSAEGNAEAIRQLGRAVELDPGYSPAWVALALAHSIAVANGYGARPKVAARLWRESIEHALLIDAHDPIAHVSLGDSRGHAGDFAGAASCFERALQVAPSNADALALLAGSLSLVWGDPRRALELALLAISLNQAAPAWYFSMLGRAAYVAGQPRRAVEALRHAPHESPHILMLQALAHGRAGDATEAQSLLARVDHQFPRYDLELFVRGYPITNPPALGLVREDAVALGLAWPRFR